MLRKISAILILATASSINGNVREIGQLREISDCMPLRQCSSFYNLAMRRYSIPGVSPFSVMSTLREKMCGWTEDDQPKVECPRPQMLAEDDEEYEEDDDYITVEEELQNMNQPKTADYMIPRKLGGGIISTKGNSVSEECQGILRIFHMENANSVLDVKETVLKYKSYKKLRKLSKRFIFRAKAEGTCCWHISEKFYYSGKKMTLKPQQHLDGYEMQPRSVRRVECDGY